MLALDTILYGHIHMSKTGGSSLNGIMANKFERVCGHKGNSNDAYADNERAKQLTGRVTKSPRFRTAPERLVQTGFEDCDYVSHEVHWSFWKDTFAGRKFHNMEMELHVPCRSTIDHLMSQCNHGNKTLDCAAEDDYEFFQSVKRCKATMERFNRALLDNFTVKCFDFKKQFTVYTEYMSQRLQPRRIVSSPYVKRETNVPRNKAQECIWKDQSLMAKAEKYLFSQYDYFAFCNECMGSENEITRDV